MTSKYAEQIGEIAETVARIDERTAGINKRLDKLNDSQAKQWDKINENEGNIKVLNTKVNIWAGIQATLKGFGLDNQCVGDAEWRCISGR